MIESLNQTDSGLNRFIYIYMYLFVIFGVVFYDTMGINFLDEAFALILSLFFIDRAFRKGVYEIKKVFVVFSISLFYLIYSFYIKSNIMVAILNDYVTQIKPFIGYFCMFSLAPRFDISQKKNIRKLCFIIWIYLIVIALLDITNTLKIHLVFGHVSRYATTAIAISLLYLVVSDITKETIIRVLILCSVGFFSTRSKFYGFFMVEALVLLWVYFSSSVRINIKTVIYSVIALCLILMVSWNKINYYFIEGAFESEDAFARPILYMVSWDILKDFFPFGSGFASFATYFSGINYSQIYGMYGIDEVYGLSEDFPDFIADTFYPSLAQFGVIGVILFFAFLFSIATKAIRYLLLNVAENKNLAVVLLLGVFFFLIESTSDTTFTHNRGFFILLLMGYAMSNLIRNSADDEA